MRIERNSNIELLRIISMFLIVAYHSMRMGYNNPSQPSPVYFTGLLLGSWGILGVDLFLIISAWFLLDQRFKAERLIGYCVQLAMYVAMFSIVRFVIVWNRDGSIVPAAKDAVLHFTDGLLEPFWCAEYWFASVYFFLCLMAPFLNYIVHSWDLRRLEKILLVGSFIPIYSNFAPYGTVTANFLFVSYIYLLIGYMRKSEKLLKTSTKTLTCFAVVIPLTILFAKYLSDHCESNGLVGYINNFTSRTLGNTDRFSCIILAEAVCLFFLIIRIKPKSNRVVNTIAANVFGIYLLHENGPFETNLIDMVFSKAESCGYLVHNYFFCLQFLSVVFAIACAGLVIEFFRVSILHRPLVRFILKICHRGITVINEFMEIE